MCFGKPPLASKPPQGLQRVEGWQTQRELCGEGLLQEPCVFKRETQLAHWEKAGRINSKPYPPGSL